MRIAQLAPLWFPVPPTKFGGTERVIHCINEGLASLGHEITLFACKGSHCRGKTIEIIDKPMFDILGGLDFKTIQGYEFLSYHQLLKQLSNFDIVHNHMGIHSLAFTPISPIPFVTTYHSSISPDFPYLAEEFKNSNFVSISDAQRKLAPNLNWVATVYNPVDFSLYEANYGKENDYLLFLGAITKNKGVHLAAKAAKQLGKKLIIAGRVIYDADKKYFQEEIAPLVDDSQVKFIGEVDDQTKNDLYRNAVAFLFPSQWEEAFGLVMIEALACGTPVIAFNKGAIPEIIGNGVNGFIVETYEEFCDKIKEVGSISRQKCRSSVENRFSPRTIAEQYTNVYSKIIQNFKK